MDKLIKKNLKNFNEAKKGVEELTRILDLSSQKTSPMKLFNDDFRFFQKMVPEKKRLSKSSPVKLKSKTPSSLKKYLLSDGYNPKKTIKFPSSLKKRRSLRNSTSKNLFGRRRRTKSNEHIGARGILPIHLEEGNQEVGDFVLMPKGVYRNLVKKIFNIFRLMLLIMKLGISCKRVE